MSGPKKTASETASETGFGDAGAAFSGAGDSPRKPRRPSKLPAKPKTEPHYHGHRDRLRDRFMKSEESLPDYEMLELVLFLAMPRRDVKETAKNLLAEFENFNAVMSAPPNRLKEVKGIGDKVVCALKVIEAAAWRFSQAGVMNRPVLTGWTQLMEYCKTRMAHREIEHFRILFLDRKNILIADEEQGSGTVDHVPVYPREVIKRALALTASALILVHNHPSGDPTPSRQDIETTRRIEEAGRAMGIVVHDHVIVGKAEDASFRKLGLL